MKKNLLFLPLVLAGLALSSCSRYDDSALSGRMTQMEGRVAKLEEQVKALNSDIVAIRTLITALQSNDYVTKVEPITEDSRSGYRISFAKSNPVLIYHGTNGSVGASPVIGVRKDGDNIYYWTLNGQWLTDTEGQKVKAQGTDGPTGVPGRDGVTPKLKIENDYWHVSYDNGRNWQSLNVKAREEQGVAGNAGSGFVQRVELSSESQPSSITFVFADGQRVELPTWYEYERLRTEVGQINRNLQSLQQIVTAVQERDYLTSVTPYMEASVQKGYTLSFARLGSLVIYHGRNGDNAQTPEIGVRKDSDNIYYWTLDGQWLTDAEGQKVKAQGTDGPLGPSGRDGVTPKLKIEGEYWHVSYDNGQNWQSLNVKARGEKGDPGRDSAPGESSTSAVFTDVQENDGYVTLTLRSGTKLLIPKGSPIAITFGHTSDIRVLAGKKYSIPYTITGATTQTKIEALAQDGFRAVVKPTNESTGLIEVTTPATIQESRVLVFVTDGRDRTIMRSLMFVEGLIRIPTRNYTAESSGEDVVVDLDTNMDYTIRIPEAAQSWVSHVSTNARAVMRSERLLFRVNPNATTQERYVAIDLVDNLGVTSETILINQRGRATMQNTTFVEHKYLVTEFVGQDCHNCYQDLRAMRKEKERKGQKLALITMHPIARLSSDVYCSDATSYIDALIGRRAVPNLAFNTLRNNPEGPEVMERRPDAIELQGGLQLSERKVKLNLKAIQRTGQSERLQGRQLKLLLWAVEEGVTADQINDSRSWVRNYLYHGLFRGSLNGVWGIDLTLGNRYDLEYTLPASLGNLEQSYLYILVCDATTHETLDVSSIALTKK